MQLADTSMKKIITLVRGCGLAVILHVGANLENLFCFWEV